MDCRCGFRISVQIGNGVCESGILVHGRGIEDATRDGVDVACCRTNVALLANNWGIAPVSLWPVGFEDLGETNVSVTVCKVYGAWSYCASRRK
jgi:hypothetical protein